MSHKLPTGVNCPGTGILARKAANALLLVLSFVLCLINLNLFARDLGKVKGKPAKSFNYNYSPKKIISLQNTKVLDLNDLLPKSGVSGINNTDRINETVTCGVDVKDSVTGYLKSATTSQIFYLLTVTNLGTSRDSFKLSKTYVGGTVVYAYIETVNGVTLTQTPGIDPGGSYSFIVRFVSPNGTPSQTNNYTKLFAQSLSCGATDSTYITTHIYGGKTPTGDSCDVGITKTANIGTVTAGNTLTYTLNILNSLAGVANDIFVIDSLPTTLQYDTAYVSLAPDTKYSLTFSSSSNTIQFRYLATLGQNQPIIITIKVRPRCTAVPSVTNRAIVSTSTYDNNAANDASSVTTTITTAFSGPAASNISSCYNSTASLTATGAPGGSGYKWYSAATGGTLLYTGQNYTTGILNNSANYYVAFYNVDTSVCEGPRTAVAVTVKAPPVVGNPANISICLNTGATFSIAASGTSPGYQWQSSSDNGSTWTDLTNTFPYSGAGDSILSIAAASYSKNGYRYRCNVTAGGCASSISSSAAILTVKQSYTWLGVNTNWNDGQNWCQGIPDSTSDVTVPSGLSYYPIITTSGLTKNITIESGASVTVSAGLLQVYGNISNNGTLDARFGSIEMKGSSSQNIAGSMFSKKTIKNLIISNTSVSGVSVSSTLNDTLKISGTLSFGNAAGKLNTGDNINLLSDSTATANVAALGAGNSIVGKVIVDRYINSGTIGTQHSAAWQFLATPTIGQTVKESWMENGNSSHGYGTQITGPGGTAKGFDLYSPGPAIKYYDTLNNNWNGVSATSASLYKSSGYMVFIKGDRTVSGSFATPTPTTLRSKGTLLIGNVGPISMAPDSYQSIGNPYASAIDFTMINKDDGVDDKFYAWDPYLNGSYGYGGYQTLSSVNDWEPIPGATPAYEGGIPFHRIQSGQAIFFHATSDTSVPAQSYNFSFTESCKVNGSSIVNTPGTFGNVPVNDKQFLRSNLFGGSDINSPVVDGNATVFSKSFSDRIDGNDALKLMNTGENFGLKRAGKILAIEARSPVNATDTIFYYMSNLRRQTYQLRFAPENMQSAGLQAFLVDKFLQTTTSVSLSDSTFVNFAVTGNSASAASDRFNIVFTALATLPVTFTSINAIQRNKNINVEWKVENEDAILKYEIEKSPDGTGFTKMASQAALHNGFGNYHWTDTNAFIGDNYYRIRSINPDGKNSYSEIVKVNIAKLVVEITVAPNPVLNGQINLRFNNEPQGIYIIRLVNSIGQIVLSKNIKHSGENIETISTGSLLKGLYQVVITKPNGDIQTLNVIY